MPIEEAIKSDFFRAALGRISAPFDGGLMLDPVDEPSGIAELDGLGSAASNGG